MEAVKKSEEFLPRRRIARITKLPINVVTARVNELLKEGMLEVVGKDWDDETGRRVELLGDTMAALDRYLPDTWWRRTAFWFKSWGRV